MTGFLILLGIAGVAALLLRLFGLRGPLLQLGAAMLLFGGAGYAIQGRPSLQGAPGERAQRAAPVPLTELRRAFFGQFTSSERWLIIAESYSRRGNSEDAVRAVRRGLDFAPGDIQLWIGLGNALVDHSRALTPAAELAYRRAAELAPGHPAPKFFFGLALARSGQPELAVALWRDVLASAPPNAGWRPYVQGALDALQPKAPAGPSKAD